MKPAASRQWKDAVVILDTNILLETRILRSALARSLLFYLREREAKLLMPEIVKHEWAEKLGDMAEDALLRARRATEEVQVLMPSLPMPPETAGIHRLAADVIDERLEQLEDLVEVLPTDYRHWEEAGRMVIQKMAPSSKRDQQFKDSMIWREVLANGLRRPTVFTTHDRAFWNAEGVGLHPQLMAEVDAADGRVSLYRGLRDLLEAIQDEELIRNAIEDAEDSISEYFITAVSDALSDFHMRPAGTEDWRQFSLLTDNPNEIVVSIDATFGTSEEDDSEEEGDGWVLTDYRFVRATGTVTLDRGFGELEASVDGLVLVEESPHHSRERVLLEPATTPSASSARTMTANAWKPSWRTSTERADSGVDDAKL